MNHFFFEVRGREKFMELRNEGPVNQAIHKARSARPNILREL